MQHTWTSSNSGAISKNFSLKTIKKVIKISNRMWRNNSFDVMSKTSTLCWRYTLNLSTADSSYSGDMLPSSCLEYELNRWPVLTYCTIKVSLWCFLKDTHVHGVLQFHTPLIYRWQLHTKIWCKDMNVNNSGFANIAREGKHSRHLVELKDRLGLDE